LNKAVFLDRDGTINEEMGYINHLSRFHILEGVFDAIKLLKHAGFKVIVITNQSGLGRGYFNEDLLNSVHEYLLEEIAKHGTQLDQIYHCPHHPVEGKGLYKVDCQCRKPKTGMIEKAQREYSIDLKKSFYIGDSYTDIKLAKNVKIKSILVLTGYGIGQHEFLKSGWENVPDYTFENLFSAAQFIWDHFRLT